MTPSSLAKSNLAYYFSKILISTAPTFFMTSMNNHPIGPAPVINIFDPNLIFPLIESIPCKTHDRGSLIYY